MRDGLPQPTEEVIGRGRGVAVDRLQHGVASYVDQALALDLWTRLVSTRR